LKVGERRKVLYRRGARKKTQDTRKDYQSTRVRSRKGEEIFVQPEGEVKGSEGLCLYWQISRDHGPGEGYQRGSLGD